MTRQFNYYMDNTSNRPFYTKFAWAYDKIIERDTKKDCEFIKRSLLKNNISLNSYILDAGCGTGNYSIELAHHGFKTVGVDLSEQQIEVAKSKLTNENSQIEFSTGNLFDLDYKNSFDSIICRGVLNDFIENNLRQEIFYKFKSYLKPDGLLIFDVRDWENSKKAKSTNPIFEKVIQLEDGELHFKSETTLNPNKKQLHIKETHKIINNRKTEKVEHDLIMRCWTKDELMNCLTNAGFSEIKLYGDYDFNVPLGKTEKIIVIAK